MNDPTDHRRSSTRGTPRERGKYGSLELSLSEPQCGPSRGRMCGRSGH
jgi:hypothetical protein